MVVSAISVCPGTLHEKVAHLAVYLGEVSRVLVAMEGLLWRACF